MTDKSKSGETAQLLQAAWAQRQRLRAEASNYHRQAEEKYVAASKEGNDALELQRRGWAGTAKASGMSAAQHLQLAQGQRVFYDASSQLAKAEKTRADGDVLKAYGDALQAQADINWYKAVVEVYGAGVKITWAKPMWNAPDGQCKLGNGDTYN